MVSWDSYQSCAGGSSLARSKTENVGVGLGGGELSACGVGEKARRREVTVQRAKDELERSTQRRKFPSPFLER